ncbi:hypothetical protein CRM22_010591 [Opisthorchis felineus]|uniref:Cyclin-like domain-containing protein n=1 Tax=Opisthorchis felineus TaxID=147828 RepID=A0A4S2KY66_OPIFE|nr:hypothetical protein CRM22_010591 [Opisthorchis felineus]
MGNQIACCRQKWSPLDDSIERLSVNNLDKANFSYQNAGAVFHDDVWLPEDSFGTVSGPTYVSISTNIQVHPGVTQHISEREPPDEEFDPSFNASQRALFVTASATPMRHGESAPDYSSSVGQVSRFHDMRGSSGKRSSNSIPLKKWSSCSTVYIGDGCLVYPHQETTLWSVAVAIELLARSPKNLDLSSLLASECIYFSPTPASIPSDSIRVYDDVYKLYDERKYSIGCSSENSVAIPKPDFVNNPKASDVHGFLRGLFSTALLAPQCAIVALIFLERLINAAEVGLLPWSWRRQLLSCLILASKLLDDQAVWNTDYCQVLRDISVDDLNALERHTLSLLQFNVDVPPAVYARYYFDLLSVGEAHGVANQPSERRRLTPELARHLRILPTQPESTTVDTRMLFDLPRTNEPLHSSCTTAAKFESNTLQKTSLTIDRQQQVPVSSLDVKPLEFRPQPSDSYVSIPVAPHLTSSTSSQLHSPPDWTPGLSTDPLTDNEPLALDDETEFINGLTLSSLLTSVPHLPASPNDGLCDIASLSHSTFSPQSIPHVQLNPTTHPRNTNTVPGQRFATHCGAPTDTSTTTMYNPVGNNGTGFIRSIMGGEVAYSLLRDAGMY